mmetsp:Transcript_31835/g.56480  ORF Transcript_31835/g.56480 Transcript_31835/m.56480 type:complete len:335 (-) Transcript_31835:53-1057(-)
MPLSTRAADGKRSALDDDDAISSNTSEGIPVVEPRAVTIGRPMDLVVGQPVNGRMTAQALADHVERVGQGPNELLNREHLRGNLQRPAPSHNNQDNEGLDKPPNKPPDKRPPKPTCAERCVPERCLPNQSRVHCGGVILVVVAFALSFVIGLGPDMDRDLEVGEFDAERRELKKKMEVEMGGQMLFAAHRSFLDTMVPSAVALNKALAEAYGLDVKTLVLSEFVYHMEQDVNKQLAIIWAWFRIFAPDASAVPDMMEHLSNMYTKEERLSVVRQILTKQGNNETRNQLFEFGGFVFCREFGTKTDLDRETLVPEMGRGFFNMEIPGCFPAFLTE